jgi:phage-related tail fiber protein
LAGYGINDAYTKLETDAKAIEIAQAECARLVASAPETLDTLDEIAAALGDDPNFATTITNLIGTKADTATVNASLDTKADKATTYTKTEVDTKLNAKANSVDVYTKS